MMGSNQNRIPRIRARLCLLLRDNGGVALIVTIMAISIIVALSVQFNRKMRDQLTSAAQVDHGLRALYIAKSGLAYGLALLQEDDRNMDWLGDSWSSNSDNLKQMNAGSKSLFGSGSFKLEIEDLSSKIQINQLVDIDELSKVFKKFLRNEDFEMDEETVSEIADATMDWIDQAGEDDDLTRASGAEDDYYMSIENPYHCKNGPFDTLEEFLSVKGVTPELFGSADDEKKLRPYLTVFGDGKININTAHVKILEALHDEITQGMAEEMAMYRDPESADDILLEQESWYHNGGVPEDIKISKKIITTKSTHFRITATGRYGHVSSGVKDDASESVERTIVAVVKRPAHEDEEGSDFQILSWKIE